LQERQAYVAKQAAMLRGVVLLVLRNQSGGLREQRNGEQ
jgi:hypothetical protein